VDLAVERGRHLAVLGPSGSGKSTLLKCLSGAVAPAKGEVTRQGRIAVIHQDLRLVRESTALRNVLHGCLGRQPARATLFSFPKEEQELAERWLRRVGLEHRSRARVSQLSGGEAQRVAVARALMQRPEIILADEPVSSLDAATAREVMGLLTGLCREEGITLVSVLHDAALARSSADRVVRLEAGRVCGDAGGCSPCASCGSATEPAGAVQTTALRVSVGAGRSEAGVGGAGSGATGSVGAGRGGAALAQGGRRSAMVFAACAIAAVLVYAWAIAGLGLTGARLSQAGEGLTRLGGQLLPSSWAQVKEIPWATFGGAMIETLRMALVGTTLGVAIALPLAVMGARNLGPRWIAAPVRQLMNVVRTVPAIVWALLMVAAVGFGPIAGVAALTAYSLGYLAKFFGEGFENAQGPAASALQELGAGGVQRFAHAIMPAAMPGLLSSCLFVLEYNVRAASVLGLVDAGGIGWHLKHHLDYRDFPAVVAALAMVLVVVIALDHLSGRVRAWAVSR
jgi:phosphonate transport system permease protein